MRGTVRARGKGRWQIQIYAGRDPVTGRERRMARTITGTKRDADAALAKLIAEHNAGKATPRNDLTVTELVDRYIAHRAQRWSPATVIEAKGQNKRYITPTIGSRPVDRLRTIEIDAAYTALLADGLAPGTVARAHSLLRAALGQAVKWQIIAVNPAHAASPPTVTKSDPATPDGVKLAKLLADLDDRPGFAAFIRLAAVTGARRGQLCALQWGDLDLEHGTVTYRRALTVTDGGVVAKATKTNREYVVALDPGTIAAVDRWRWVAMDAHAHCGSLPGPTTWVFEREPGGEPWYPDTTSRWWRQIRDNYGLAGVKLHGLRHFMATELLGAGVDPVTVAGRGGWSNPTTPMNVYARFLPPKDQEAATIMGDLLDGPDPE